MTQQHCFLRVDIYNFVLLQQFVKMVSTRMKKNQHKKHLNQLNETLYDVIISNGAYVSVVENETLGQQASNHHKVSRGSLTVQVKTKS